MRTVSLSGNWNPPVTQLPLNIPEKLSVAQHLEPNFTFSPPSDEDVSLKTEAALIKALENSTIANQDFIERQTQEFGINEEQMVRCGCPKCRPP